MCQRHAEGARERMPDAVVIRVPKVDWETQRGAVADANDAEKMKVVAQSKWRWALTLPWRVLRGMAASCWRRLTGARVKE